MMNLIEGLKMKIKVLEELSHEPQNYKKKCEAMERRIERLEILTKVNTVMLAILPMGGEKEIGLSKLESIITEMTNENKEPT